MNIVSNGLHKDIIKHKYAHAPYKLMAIIIFLIYAPLGLTAVIHLKPGYWEYAQQTNIQGYPIPIPDVKGFECVHEKDAAQPLQYYVDKFKAGLGPDVNCALSNVKQSGNKVTASLQCLSPLMGSSNHTLVINHSRTKVEVQATGEVSIVGTSFTTVTKATSIWKRHCKNTTVPTQSSIKIDK